MATKKDTTEQKETLTKGGDNDIDKQIEQLKKCNYIDEGQVKNLCQNAMEILMEESNVQRVDPPVIVQLIPSAPNDQEHHPLINA